MKKKFLAILTLILLSHLGTVSGAQSCQCALTPGGCAVPGMPIDINVRFYGNSVEIVKHNATIASVDRYDSSTLANEIINQIEKPEYSKASGYRMKFEGELDQNDITTLMGNLAAETTRRDLGFVEGSYSGGGGKKGNNNGGSGSRKGLMGNGRQRYDFTKSTITTRNPAPLQLDSAGNRFYQRFFVDVPSTPSPLDFIVNVIFGSRRAAMEVIEDPNEVIRKALHQEKLNNATFRQGANEILKYIRSVDKDWDARVEGSDVTLVDIKRSYLNHLASNSKNGVIWVW